MLRERIVGRYSGQAKGPLFVCLGGIHGNETAGVQAIARFFGDLGTAPELPFRGTVLGLKGNLAALEKGTRFIDRDLNRIMTPEMLRKTESMPAEALSGELLELKELLVHIGRELETGLHDTMVLLDLHTTSAGGGVFCIPADDPGSLELARRLHAPVIKGMTGGLEGTSLSFFTPEYGGVPCRAVAFEAGQNDDRLSVLRSVGAIKCGLVAAGCIPAGRLSNPEERLLLEYAEGLPPVSELVWVHHIRPDDGFRMHLGYRNFQQVSKGEHLADDQKGPVLAPADGMILMPLYQPQGSNGFFLVRPVI